LSLGLFDLLTNKISRDEGGQNSAAAGDERLVPVEPKIDATERLARRDRLSDGVDIASTERIEGAEKAERSHRYAEKKLHDYLCTWRNGLPWPRAIVLILR
jgi:hypothetical protein